MAAAAATASRAIVKNSLRARGSAASGPSPSLLQSRPGRLRGEVRPLVSVVLRHPGDGGQRLVECFDPPGCDQERFVGREVNALELGEVVAQLALELGVADLVAPLGDQGFESVVDPRKLSAGGARSGSGRLPAPEACGLNGVMDQFMQAAIDEARKGRATGGIPIGAVLVHDGEIIGRGHNRRVQMGSAIRHGETDALENAGRLPAGVYRDSVMYTTLSPCSMCTGAILLYGIGEVVVGENRTFMGEEALLAERGVSVTVLDDETCVAMMRDFIEAEPALWNEDIGED